MCSHCQGHEKSTMSIQSFGPAPNFSKIVGVRLGARVGNVLPQPWPCEINNVQSGPWSCPQLFQNSPWHFYWVSGWEPEWKMCFPFTGHKKSTMSNQTPDPTPNFSKMGLCSSVKLQIGNLSGKRASLPRAKKNHQCPVRLLTLLPTFSKWSFAVLVGFRLRTLNGKCASLPRAMEKQQYPVRLLTLPPTFSKLSVAVLLGFRLGTWVENVLPFPGP